MNNNPWFIAALVSGSISVLICLVTFLFNNRKLTLIFRFSFDIVSIFNGICVYLATDNIAIFALVATDAIGLFRDIIYYFREDHKWADHIIWLIIFEVLFALSPILVIAMQQESGFDAMVLLPAIGSVITNYAFYLKNVKTTKALNIFGQTFYIAYNAILIQSTSALSILQLICSVTFFVSACIGIVMIFNKERITQNPNK